MNLSMPSRPSRAEIAAYVVRVAVPVILLSGYVIYKITPRDGRIISLTIEEAKAHGTYVARIVQVSGAPIVGDDSKVERLWRHEGRFRPRRVIDEGYTTSVHPDWARIGTQRVRFYVRADTIQENCCLVVTKSVPTAAWLVLWYDDPVRRDTVELRFVP